MRKDVRLGAAIGGILIAVLIVYGIVVSRSQPKKDVVIDKGTGAPAGETGGTTPLGTPDGGAISDPADGAPPAAPSDSPQSGTDPTAVPPAGAPPLHADTGAPAPAHTGGTAPHRMTDWSALLQADHVVLTNTPTDGVPSADMVGTPEHHAQTGTGTHRTPAANPLETPAADSMPTPKTYTIKSGDTLSSIAKEVYGDSRYYKQIMKANPKIDPAKLHPGVRISLPDRAQIKHTAAASDNGSRASTDHPAAAAPKPERANSATEYRVQSGDSLYKISMKLYHTPNKVDAIYQLNKGTIGADPAKLKLNMPLKLPEAPTQTA